MTKKKLNSSQKRDISNFYEQATILLNSLALDENNFTKYPIIPPQILPGVLPKGTKTAPTCTMDNAIYNMDFPSQYIGQSTFLQFQGFPGFAYLSELTTRPEYRQFADVNATELVRAWIKFNSNDTEDSQTKERITILEQIMSEMDIQGVIRKASTHCDFFGRAQIYLDIANADPMTPLILSSRTIQKGSLRTIKTIEPIWTTPSNYNALQPGAKDFYRPTGWFVMGQEMHASRLLTVITRELPDLFKPAFNFAGISLSQLAEPYVNNWLKTRQAISDLVNNFSILSLKTDMTAILQGDKNGGMGLKKRADLFTKLRSNKGIFLLDKDMEELEQLAVPISGLAELQSQVQEHLCTVSGIPAVKLLGVSPQGFNATADGEIRTFYDKKNSEQEAFWRHPLDLIIKTIMLSEFGEIDKSISFAFNPLWQLDAAEEEAVKNTRAQTNAIYINDGVFSNAEIREILARDPESGFNGIQIDEEDSDPDIDKNDLAEQQKELQQEPYESGEQFTETTRQREQTIS